MSSLDKTIEKLINSRLSKFLEDKKILYYKDFGFRNTFSTAHAIIDLIENIQKALDD